MTQCQRKHHIIYKTTCPVSGHWYIGMHSTDNLNDNYLGSGSHLVRSVKKHGRNQHTREILEFLPNRKSFITREAAANRAKGHKRSREQLANLREGQTKYHMNVDKNILRERGLRCGETRAKVWIIEDILGTTHQIKNLKKFSEANGIKGTALYKTECVGTYCNGYRVGGRA